MGRGAGKGKRREGENFAIYFVFSLIGVRVVGVEHKVLEYSRKLYHGYLSPRYNANRRKALNSALALFGGEGGSPLGDSAQRVEFGVIVWTITVILIISYYDYDYDYDYDWIWIWIWIIGVYMYVYLCLI